VALRSRAKARDLTLNEYGIFNAGCREYTKQNQLVGKTEEEVYKFLDLPLIVPENRTGHI
jgi:DNA polymerase/3'-5' exonuclease PolX